MSNSSKDTDHPKSEVDNEEGFTKRSKIITTAVIFYGNITFGCAMNAFSPALTDFKNKYDEDTSTISIVFTVSIACYMVGALLCSFIYNLMNRQLAVAILFIGIATSMYVAPHLPTLMSFYAVGGLLGFCMGCYDTAQVVWVMEMWQHKSAPYIQAQHFFFAIGSVLPSLMMSPFLTKEDEDIGDIVTFTASTSKNENSRLFVPFTIIGCLCAVTVVAQSLLFIFMRYKAPPPTKEIGDKGKEKVAKKSGNWFQRQWPGWHVARLVILTALFIGFDQGMEMCTMQLFPTFGQRSSLGLSEAESANSFTGLTAAFTVARGLATILIFKIPSLYFLLADIGIVAVGNVILVGWGNTSLPMLWTAGILYGLGFSSLMPSFCAYMERYLEFTNTIGGIIIVTGSLVGSCYPLIVGRFIDDHPLVLTYPIFFSVFVMIFSLTIAFRINRSNKG